MSKGGKNGTT